MKRELHFRPHCKMHLNSKQLRRTFRDIPTDKSTNRYEIGDTVRGRIWHTPEHHDPYFEDNEYKLKIVAVNHRHIRDLSHEDFVYSDAYSKADLKRKMKNYYSRDYTDNDRVRVIDFEILL